MASALKVPAEAIKNFDEEMAIYNIQNNYEGSNPNALNVNAQQYQCTLNFNPLDKYVEEVENNKRLYEALLKSEREKNALLEKLLNEKKKWKKTGTIEIRWLFLLEKEVTKGKTEIKIGNIGNIYSLSRSIQ